MKTINVVLNARDFEDDDDSLAAAAAHYVETHPEAKGWDLDPRWKDNQRSFILLTAPVDVGFFVEYRGWDGSESGTVLAIEDSPGIPGVTPNALRLQIDNKITCSGSENEPHRWYRVSELICTSTRRRAAIVV